MILFILSTLYLVKAELIKYGNVSYQDSVSYEISNPRNLHLKLISETGDADLYVFKLARFDKTKINFSDYQFKSDSFGTDTITISRDFDVASSIVVFGVAQGDSRYSLEISSVIHTELDYPTIDEVIQRSPGSSYEELCLQHSFDSNTYYAEEEKARLKLLSTDTFSEEPDKASIPVKRKKSSFKDGSGVKSRKQRQPDDKRSSLMDEDSFLYHFLLWLLEFIVDVFF